MTDEERRAQSGLIFRIRQLARIVENSIEVGEFHVAYTAANRLARLVPTLIDDEEQKEDE